MGTLFKMILKFKTLILWLLTLAVGWLRKPPAPVLVPPQEPVLLTEAPPAEAPAPEPAPATEVDPVPPPAVVSPVPPDPPVMSEAPAPAPPPEPEPLPEEIRYPHLTDPSIGVSSAYFWNVIQAAGGQLTKNFSLAEFACVDGTPVPEELSEAVLVVAQNLQVLRDVIGKPITIVGGYRTPTHNQKIGGDPNTHHYTASAVDIAVAGMTPKAVALAITELMAAGQMCPGSVVFHPTFTHYDICGVMAFGKGSRKQV